jgi:hypothetical protein
MLDGHGRRVAHPAAGPDTWSAEDRPAALLAALLEDAAAPPRHADTTREREALQHFRAATRHAAPSQRSMRQRVAALSATAKVLSVAVGATATGGVALASASVPLGHGLRPFTSQTSDAQPGRSDPRRAGTPGGPTAASTATALASPGSGDPGDPATVGGSRGRNEHSHWGGVAPGPGPTGFPKPHNPVTGPTDPATTPTTTGPTTTPSFDFSLPVEEPTTDPPISRAPPGFEEPPTDEDPTPTPSDDVGGEHPDPDPSTSRTPPE